MLFCTWLTMLKHVQSVIVGYEYDLRTYVTTYASSTVSWHFGAETNIFTIFLL